MLLQPECSPTFSESRIDSPLALSHWSIFIQWDGTRERHPTSVPTSAGSTCFLLWCECFCPLRFHPQVPKKKILTQEKIVIIYLCPPTSSPYYHPREAGLSLCPFNDPQPFYVIWLNTGQLGRAESPHCPAAQQMAELNKYIHGTKGPQQSKEGTQWKWLQLTLSL